MKTIEFATELVRSVFQSNGYTNEVVRAEVDSIFVDVASGVDPRTGLRQDDARSGGLATGSFTVQVTFSTRCSAYNAETEAFVKAIDRLGTVVGSQDVWVDEHYVRELGESGLKMKFAFIHWLQKRLLPALFDPSRVLDTEV